MRTENNHELKGRYTLSSRLPKLKRRRDRSCALPQATETPLFTPPLGEHSLYQRLTERPTHSSTSTAPAPAPTSVPRSLTPPRFYTLRKKVRGAPAPPSEAKAQGRGERLPPPAGALRPQPAAPRGLAAGGRGAAQGDRPRLVPAALLRGRGFFFFFFFFLGRLRRRRWRQTERRWG